MKVPPNKGMGESSAEYQFRRRYGAAVAHYLNDVQLVGLGGQDLHHKPVSVADIYVPLRLHTEDTKADASQEEIARGMGVTAALKSYSYVAASGPPGSGKSTVVRALSFGLGHPKPTPITASLGDILPVPIFLRKHSKHLEKVKDWDSFLTLWCREFGKDIIFEFFPENLLPFIERGACLFMFDGVDELGEKNRILIRDFVIAQLIQRYPDNFVIVTGRPNGFQSCPYDFKKLQESRSEGSQTHKILNLELPSDDLVKPPKRRALGLFGKPTLISRRTKILEVDIQIEREKGAILFVQPFSHEDIQAFAGKWFELREKSKRDREAALKAFLTALERIPTLAELQNRPVYLTLLAIVHGNTGNLPHSRAEAYREIVQAYLGQLDALRRLNEDTYGFEAVVPNWRDEDKKRILEALAFELHTRGLNQKEQTFTPDSDLHLEISRTELLKLLGTIMGDLQQYQPQFSLDDSYQGDPGKVLAYFEARTGFLVETSHEIYQFSHLSFQEYLAAYHLYRMMRSGHFLFNMDAFLNEVLWPKLQFESFHETGLLFFSICALEGIGNLDALLQRMVAYAETQENIDGFVLFWIKLLAHRDQHLSESYKQTFAVRQLWDWVNRLKYPVACHRVLEREWQEPPCEVIFNMDWLLKELTKPQGQERVAGFLFLFQPIEWFRKKLNHQGLKSWLATQDQTTPTLNAVLFLLDACEQEWAFPSIRHRMSVETCLVDNIHWHWEKMVPGLTRLKTMKRTLTFWLTPVAIGELNGHGQRQPKNYASFWFLMENSFSHLLKTVFSFKDSENRPQYWVKALRQISKTKGEAVDRAQAQIWEKSLAISLVLEFSRTLALNPALDMELARALTVALNLTQNVAEANGLPLILNPPEAENREYDVGFVFELARDKRRTIGGQQNLQEFKEIVRKISKPLFLWLFMTSLWNELSISKIPYKSFSEAKEIIDSPETHFSQEKGETDLLYGDFLKKCRTWLDPEGFFMEAHRFKINRQDFPISRGTLNRSLLPHLESYNRALRVLRVKE